jgi:hypothetical protein
MKLFIWLAGLLGLGATLGFAETWPGALVDAKCYAAFERNTKQTLFYVDRDIGTEIRYCTPSAKTSSFAVVQEDSLALALDAEGNAQAAELVKKVGRKSPILVDVAGEKVQNTIKVTTLSLSGQQVN